MSNEAHIVLDAAGARTGGAARFLGQLHDYLGAVNRPDVRLIGQDRFLTPSWVLRRERLAGARSRIALNNVGFFGGQRRVTLLRNALHFARAEEFAAVQVTPGPTFRTQTALVRTAARRSSLLVVPCTAMADRVAAHLPQVRDRMVVRHHPVAQASWAHEIRERRPVVLVPVLSAPYKHLDAHLSLLLQAAQLAGRDIEVQMTDDGGDFPPSLRTDPRVSFIGRLDASQLDARWRDAAAVYFPTRIESFGYPLAEARANGVPVLALSTPQNHEIAGPALRGFHADSVEGLALALIDGLEWRPEPDPGPFDPTTYFSWLLEAAS